MKNRAIAFVLLLALVCAGCASKKIDELIAQATEAQGMHEFDKAAELYKQIIERYPNHYKTQKVYISMGDLYQFNFNDPAAAEKQYNFVIEKWPRSTSAQLAFEALISLHENTGRYESALEDIYAMMKLFNRDIDERNLFHHAGDLHFKLGNYEQARVEYRKTVSDKSSPKDDIYQDSFFDMAESYFMEKDITTALALYRSFVQQFPKSEMAPLALAHLSDCYEENGDLFQAIEIQKLIKSRYPDSRVADTKIKQLEDRRAKMTASPLKEQKMKYQAK